MIVSGTREWIRSLTWLVLLAAPAVGAEPGTERLEEMRRLAREITLIDADGRTAELRTEPIVRYDDQLRHIEDASLWIFGGQGRPTAALKVEIYSGGRALHGLVSLAPGELTAKSDGWRWSSTRPGVVLRPIPNAPAPADSERARLIQLREISRRFSGYQIDGNERGRLQLRLLSRPIHRYSDRDAGLQDGAIFALANGTNPDVLILIESRPAAGASTPSWHYGFARLGGSPAWISLDNKEVLSLTSAYPPAELDTYMNRVFPRAR